MNKGLIVRKPWTDLILSGKKSYELRGSACHIRGRIKIIESGSGMVVGECDLVDSIPLSLKDFKKNRDKHQVFENALPYPQTFAWVLSNPRRYKKPIPYQHKQGCVIWINL